MEIEAYVDYTFDGKTYLIVIGKDEFEMSSDANMPNGVNHYIGTRRPSDVPYNKEECLKKVELGDLPKGTLLGIISRLRNEITLIKDAIVERCSQPEEFSVGTIIESVSDYMTEADHKKIEDSRE